MTRPLTVLPFPGVHPDTLGHYLSGLGLLVAVGQRWPDVRGCWRGSRFVLLHESLTEEDVQKYLLAEWQPTRYERWWAKAQAAKDQSAVQRERNGRSIREVQLLEAHLVAVPQSRFNPLFGTGGVLMRREFPKVHACCVELVTLSRAGQSTGVKLPAYFQQFTRQFAKAAPECRMEQARKWLGYTLQGEESAPLPPLRSAGTWFVFGNEASNTGQGWTREDTTLSPWSYLLAAEGAFLLVGDVNRRLGAKARPYAVFPFICDPAQPTTAGEVGMLRGEFWGPLWDSPATLAEVRHLLRRGLARVGSRSAHAPAEFAVAALGAGADAGVAGFARFELRQTTSAKVYEAVPRGQVAVARPGEAGGSERLAASELLAELVSWLSRFPDEPRKADQRGRFRGFRGPVEGAVIRVSEAIGRPEEPGRWRELMLELTRQQARIDRNKAFRESLPPLPGLRPGWFDRAWPAGSFPEEIAVARAVASVGAGTPSPVIVNVFGVQPDGRRGHAFVPGGRSARAVWDGGQPIRVLGRLLRRRLIDADAGRPLPVGGPCRAPLAAVSRLLVGDLDLDLTAAWLPPLALIDWAGVRVSPPPGEVRFAGELLLWGLFRPIFHEDPHGLFRWLPEEARPALARRTLHLIQAGNLDEAVRGAKGYYRAAGRRVVDVPVGPHGGEDLAARLSAALLVPAAERDIRNGLARWLVPEKSTNE